MGEPLNSVLLLPSFLRKAKGLLSDEEVFDLTAYLAEHPDKGDIMQDTGGIRKLRWARRGAGKSSGYRIIYYFCSENIPVFVITLYAKNEKANLTQAERNEMKYLAAWLSEYGRRKS